MFLSQPLLPVAACRIQNRECYKENKLTLKQQDGEKRRVKEKRESASKFRITYQIKNSRRRQWRAEFTPKKIVSSTEDKLENMPQYEEENDNEMKTTRERKIAIQKQEQRYNRDN